MMTTNLDPRPYAFTHSDGTETRVRIYVPKQEDYGWVFSPRAGYSLDEADYR